MWRHDLECQLHPGSMDTEDGGGTCMRSMLKWDLHAETIQLMVKDDIHNDSCLVLWIMLYLFSHVCRAAVGMAEQSPEGSRSAPHSLPEAPAQTLPDSSCSEGIPQELLPAGHRSYCSSAATVWKHHTEGGGIHQLWSGSHSYIWISWICAISGTKRFDLDWPHLSGSLPL